MARLSRLLPCLILLSVGIFAAHGQEAKATPEAGLTPSLPTVQMVAFLGPGLGYATSLAYMTEVNEVQARADVAALASALGYTSVNDLKPTDADGKEVDLDYSKVDNVAQIGFRLTEAAFSRSGGTFPLEAVINALRRYRRIDLSFDVGQLGPEPFTYRGLRSYVDDNVRIGFRERGQTFDFTVEIINPDYSRLDLPATVSAETPLGAMPAQSAAAGRSWLAGALAALGAGLLVFVFASWWMSRRAGAKRP